MKQKVELKDYGIKIGTLPSGERNSITDVEGITVGHSTISDGDIQTGVTSILPHSGNIFQEKVTGALYTINGFGKTIGSIQIEELGTIETPIVLTNTLAVGVGVQGVIEYTLQNNPEIGRTTGTVNAVVCECNDMILNDIRKVSITKEDVLKSIGQASIEFDEGNVGAGTGMVCFGLKGGIGSSSRVISIQNNTYTIGALVLTNFGKLENLTISGKLVGPLIKEQIENIQMDEREKGSIIMIIATDIPLNERQLKRVLKRTTIGLSKTGSYIGHGSGDIALGFTTANKKSHEDKSLFTNNQTIQDHYLDVVFQGTADATEEAILNSLFSSNTTVGRNRQKIYSLREFTNTIL
jgi:D-aminopeptidase